MSTKRRPDISALRSSRSESRTQPLPAHGALKLPAATVDSYNLDVVHEGQRLAARTNKRALKLAFDHWRKIARRSGADPFGDCDSMAITKKELDAALASKDHDARCIVHGAIEEFAHSLALLAERFLEVREWRGTERIAVGGGLRASNTGELIVRRAHALLHQPGLRVELGPIRSHPHEAALLGAAHLFPSWMLADYDAILAVDIGGTNVRIGVVRLNLRKGDDLSQAEVWKRVVWRHADEKVTRDDVVRTIGRTMKKLAGKATAKDLRLSPCIGIACPGAIEADGTIGSGSEVLPGDWQAPKFHLPSRLSETIPAIDGRETLVVLHNDAVVQGLSEIPFLGKCRRWGIFTVGTGLGNARFSLR